MTLILSNGVTGSLFPQWCASRSGPVLDPEGLGPEWEALQGRMARQAKLALGAEFFFQIFYEMFGFFRRIQRIKSRSGWWRR